MLSLRTGCTISLFFIFGLTAFSFGFPIARCYAQTQGVAAEALSAGPFQLAPSIASGQCADVQGVSKLNSAAVQLWQCGGAASTNQLWTLQPKVGSYGTGYQIISANSGLCLDVIGQSTADGAHLQQYECGGETQANQIWQVYPFGNSYELVSLNSGRCLDLPGGNTANGNLLQQWDCGNGYNANQLWHLVPVNAPQPSTSATQRNAVPLNYFGLTVLNFEGLQPQAAFGTARSWDEYPGLDWADANPASGTYNFNGIDAFIQQNQKAGRDMIYTFGRTPLWASSKPQASTPYGMGQCGAPANLSSWDAYVYAIVTHAAGRIHYWELWNEADDVQFYCSDVPSLVNMAADAYRIIKGIDPTAQVLSPSTTSYPGPGWISQYLQAGGGQFADILSVHGYWDTQAEDITLALQSYASVFAAYGQSAKPLWDTETSFSPNPSSTPMSPVNCGAFLAKEYLLQWQSGVSRFVWYAYDGGQGGSLWDPVNGLSLAGTAYNTVQQWMVGSTITKPCAADSNNTWTCILSRNGSTAEVIWNSGTTLSIETAPSYTVRTDLTGKSTAISASTVQIGNSPLLIHGSGTF